MVPAPLEAEDRGTDDPSHTPEPRLPVAGRVLNPHLEEIQTKKVSQIWHKRKGVETARSSIALVKTQPPKQENPAKRKSTNARMDYRGNTKTATSHPRTLDSPIEKEPLRSVDSIIREVDIFRDGRSGMPTGTTPPTPDDSARVPLDDPGDTLTPATPPTGDSDLVTPVEVPRHL